MADTFLKHEASQHRHDKSRSQWESRWIWC